MPALRSHRPAAVRVPAPPARGRPAPPPFVPLALVAGLGTAAAIWLIAPDAGLLLTIPALALGAMAAWRWPALAVTAAFVVTGMVNVLLSHTPVLVDDLVDYLLASLWLGVLGSYVIGRPALRPWLWPPLLAAVLYVGLTALEAALTEPAWLGIRSFRLAAWYMAALLLVALAPWPLRTHLRIAKGVLLAALVVGAYSVLRLAIGASAAETVTALQLMPQPHVGLRFFGSFSSAFQLAVWTAAVIPFCFAALLAWRRGPWRIAALGAIALLALALLASEVRTGLVAAAVGTAVTAGLFVLAPAFRRQRQIAIPALLAMALIGAGAFAATVASDPERLDRYARILSPGEDEAYSIRVARWEQALDDIRERPWGHGLATVGYVSRFNEQGPAGPAILDSAYLKVGLEQGIAVMVLYALALLLLLAGLVWRTLKMADPERAMLAAGGAGALAALMVMLYTGMYSEGSTVVAAWLLVGLGAAQVTTAAGRRAPTRSRVRA